MLNSECHHCSLKPKDGKWKIRNAIRVVENRFLEEVIWSCEKKLSTRYLGKNVPGVTNLPLINEQNP